jgi:hypothetical protein
MIFMGRKKNAKRLPQVFKVGHNVPLPIIDGVNAINGDQFYYPHNRKRYLATCDEWIDISEHFKSQAKEN